MASNGSTASKRSGFLLLTGLLAAWTSCQMKTGGLAGGRDAALGPDAGKGGAAGGPDGASTIVDGLVGMDDVDPYFTLDGGERAGSGGADGNDGGTGGLSGMDAARTKLDGSALGGSVGADGSPAAGGTAGAGTGGTTGSDGSLLGPDGGYDGEGSPDAAADLFPAPGVDANQLKDLGFPADARAERPATRDAADAAAPDSKPVSSPVWSDEFNGPADTGVDLTKWTYVTWAPGHVNNEKQLYTSSTNNVFLDGDGHLVIRALYTPMAMNDYTSGRIETSGKATFSPGHRIEVRAKLPAGKGSFPGIIMMGTTGAWPQNGELALMEQYGQDKSWFYATASAGSGAGSGSTGNVRYDFPDASTASTDFHVYAVDWYPDHLEFSVDGDAVVSSTFTAASPFSSIPEYIVLDLALGGTMGGDIANADFPMEMVVDYVRVYEL